MGDLIEEVRMGYETDVEMGAWDRWVGFPASIVGAVDLILGVCAVTGLGVMLAVAVVLGEETLAEMAREWIVTVGMFALGVLMLCMACVWLGYLLDKRNEKSGE